MSKPSHHLNKRPWILPLGRDRDGNAVHCGRNRCTADAEWAVGWSRDPLESLVLFSRCREHAAEFCEAVGIGKPKGLGS